MQVDDSPVTTDLVLVGGGHSHLFVLETQANRRGATRYQHLLQRCIQTFTTRLAAHVGGKQDTACTDVTGFGLAGHLFEMVRASGCMVELDVDQLPLMQGAVELARQGISSSLQPQNLRIRHAVDDTAAYARHGAYPLLFDPQTAGELLASVPAQSAQQCLQQLRECGYHAAQIIGQVSTAPKDGARRAAGRIRLSAI